MTTDREDMHATALGHLQRGMETYVDVPVFTSGDREGQVDERLQDRALVSPDVRAIMVEPDDAGAWNVLDVDTEDTVAWFALLSPSC